MQWLPISTSSAAAIITPTFKKVPSPIVIRWKDLFERLEAAIDATEQVANILEGIVIKNS